jgi:hypothetical protein
MKIKRLLKTTIFYIFTLSFIFSCAKKEDNNKIVQIKYGIFAGMCIGYCRWDLTIKSGEITYNRSGWVDSIETITCTEIPEYENWESVKTGLNIYLFFKLPETIGCPDCADGGAEWIEIELENGDKHKVTFEAGNEPGLLKDFVVKLREMMSQSLNCGEY